MDHRKILQDILNKSNNTKTRLLNESTDGISLVELLGKKVVSNKKRYDVNIKNVNPSYLTDDIEVCDTARCLLDDGEEFDEPAKR